MDSQDGPEFTVTVTGSTGQFTDTCRVRTYCGEINIPSDWEYTFFLDYEVMTNLHGLEVDGVPVITQKNFWLPPAVDVQVKLSAGKHRLKITATKGQPRLSYRPQTDQTVLRSPHAGALDYVVFAGPRPDEIIAAFRAVTGTAPLLPRWAYGFWQCRERYETQAQLLENAREYRARDLPVDVMVQDWQYWPKDQWAGMQFDPDRFPDPSGLVGDLLALNLRLIISVWENVNKDSELGRSYEASGYYIPDSPWLDVMNPSASAAHWAAMDKNLNHLGIAGWWLDGTEPENDALVGKRTHLGPGERHRLTYPLYVSQAVAEGQRNATPERRACILTRSSFPGQQRYNTITWSGDIGGDWDAFRRQIVAGLNYCASGLPYWTTDIGGFFRPDDQYTNPAYHELLTRWFQYGVFNPILRIHGFGSKTEVWRFGARFEENTRQMLNLRYRLLPYIYSVAWQVTHTGATLMRPLMWDFPNESAAREAFAFLFGPAFLVAPITGPGVTAQPVALPQPTTWYDFWTGSQHLGGQTIVSTAPLERIPLFVRAGSLVPLGPFLQHTSEKPADPIELRIYPGADGRFELYEDAGDGQAYEQGELAVIPMCWDDDASTLTLGARRGSFPGMTVKRTFRLVLVRENHGIGIGQTSVPDQEVVYTGTSLPNPIRKLVS
ncbi:MAG: DUF5110 domain-containing protein [Verrucomicrobia bacterium]|nr:DUF5110 domain-containing protein [Verrucomicrobiota bacterium]